jgi:hypothetical protein
MKQCNNRWHADLNHTTCEASGRKKGSRWAAVDPNNGRASWRTGKWAEYEDIKLKDAAKTHGDKNWGSIAALVPGRTQKQCRDRWNSIIDRANGRTGKWTAVEDSKLEDAIQTHGDKDWLAISALVPGRTKIQCQRRWNDVLDPSIGRASGRRTMGKWVANVDSADADPVEGNRAVGYWTPEEDAKLTSAVTNTYKKKFGKEYKTNWVAIAGLVSSRTKKQCSDRWYNVLDPNIYRATGRGRTGKWSKDEDMKLKNAAQTHGGKNWVAIAALVQGRTNEQCRNRWCGILDPNIGQASGHMGKWTASEDIQLKDAVQTQGDKDWVAISTLVPSRTKRQCWDRWKKHMDPNRSTVRGK